jgi:GDP-D-mannose dehydratase
MGKIDKKKALIAEVSDHDGAYPAQFSLDKGYQVFETFWEVLISSPEMNRLAQARRM